jgi:uncharacterized protein YkwD
MDGHLAPVPLTALALAIGWACTGPAAAQTLPSLPGAQDVLSTATIDATPPPIGLPGAGGTLPALSPFGTLLGPGAGPELLSLLAPSQPVAGRPATFTVSASDPAGPIRGLSADFGEAQGRFGETACRRSNTRRSATLSVPYSFSRPGLHTIRLEVTAGGCGGRARATIATLSLVVGPAPARSAPRAARTPDSAVAAANCAGADRRPRASTIKAAAHATLCLIDAARVADGRSRLHTSRRLRHLATAHSRNMISHKYFDHTEPPNRTLVARLRSIHWSADAGENLGYAEGVLSTPRSLTAAWLRSSEHRANMLDRSFHYIGIGIVMGTPLVHGRRGATYTTDFGG